MTDVLRAVKQLSVGISAGADRIPAEAWRLSIPRLNVHLALLLNACMRHCYLPSMLMRTTLVQLSPVVPLHRRVFPSGLKPAFSCQTLTDLRMRKDFSESI